MIGREDMSRKGAKGKGAKEDMIGAEYVNLYFEISIRGQDES